MTEELEKNIEETAEDLLIIEDFEPEEKEMRVVPLRGMVIPP